MPTRDLVHRIAVSPSIASTTVASNTTTNGTGVDSLGYESITMVAQVMTRTDGTYTFHVDDSADNSTFTTLIDLSTATAAQGNQVIGGSNLAALSAVGVALLGISQCRRYVRAVDVSTAVTTGGTIRADFILSHPRHSGAAV